MPTRRLVDIGTGSGILGITAKLRHPDLDVTLLDTSKPALVVAGKNASQLGVDISMMQSDLLGSYPFAPISPNTNLPYVDKDWECSPEPDMSQPRHSSPNRHGLALIERCLDQLSHRAKPGSIAILEADPQAMEGCSSSGIARKAGYSCIKQGGFAATYRKTSTRRVLYLQSLSHCHAR